MHIYTNITSSLLSQQKNIPIIVLNGNPSNIEITALVVVILVLINSNDLNNQAFNYNLWGYSLDKLKYLRFRQRLIST